MVLIPKHIDNKSLIDHDCFVKRQLKVIVQQIWFYIKIY